MSAPSNPPLDNYTYIAERLAAVEAAINKSTDPYLSALILAEIASVLSGSDPSLPLKGKPGAQFYILAAIARIAREPRCMSPERRTILHEQIDLAWPVRADWAGSKVSWLDRYNPADEVLAPNWIPETNKDATRLEDVQRNGT